MKICILTAGKGARIGDLCKNINKALLPIDHKAILSKIIDSSVILNKCFLFTIDIPQNKIKLNALKQTTN